MPEVNMNGLDRRPYLHINGNEFRPTQIVKIDNGQEAAALDQVKKNGADDVVFKMTNDTYVASGRGLAVETVFKGQQVLLGKAAGEVALVDDQVNTAADGAILGGMGGFAASAAVVGIGALLVLGVGVNMAGMVLVAAAAILIVPPLIGGSTAIGAAVGGAWAEARSLDLGSMLKLGKAVD